MMTVLWVVLVYWLIGLVLFSATWFNDWLRGEAVALRRHWRGAVVLVLAWPWAVWAICAESSARKVGGE